MVPQFVCARVREMEVAAPDPPADSAERVIRLNATENPFPPSPKVMQAIREIEPEMLRRYPANASDDFCAIAATTFGISREMILCGNGCEDILGVAFRTIAGAGGSVASPVSGRSSYRAIAQREEVKFHGIDWSKDWSLPLDRLLASKANLIVLANPNNPSGTLVLGEQIENLAEQFDGAIVVDESYIDFADDNSNAVSLVKSHANLVVARSLSKGYSLAGLRFGFAIAQAPVIEQMNKMADHYAVSIVAARAAGAALTDPEYAAMTWQHVRDERTRVLRELVSLGWQLQPSHANFLLASLPDSTGREIFNRLKRQGILVHHFAQPELVDHIRITIGATQENNALLIALKELTAPGKAA